MNSNRRIAVGGFGAESNVFSIERPGNDFADVALGSEILSIHKGRRTVVGGFIDAVSGINVEIVPMLKVWWGATGVIVKESYEYYMEQMLQQVRDAGILDGVLLDLHGAMMAENTPDAEGVLLKEIRSIIGKDTPIVCVLDLHGNITDLKVRSADAIFGYKTNPHIDLYERALKAGLTLLSIINKQIKPVMYLKRLPMLGHNIGMSTWAYDSKAEERLPMARVMRRVAELEDEKDMLDISVFIGFAHSDIPECVTSILTISNANHSLAERVAEKVAGIVWNLRYEFVNLRPLIPVDEAVERGVKASAGPIILVDGGDNSGGGGPCDNTVILEALIRKGAEDAVMPLRDSEAVSKAFEAGVGSIIELEVGGKIDSRFYKPVKIKAKVKTLSDGRYVIRGPSHGGYGRREGAKDAWREANVGRMALLRIDGLDIILSEGRVGMERDFYKAVGVDPAERKIVVVKSAQAHRAAFEGIAKEIIEVDTPGPTSPSYRGLIFKNIQRPVFPLDQI